MTRGAHEVSGPGRPTAHGSQLPWDPQGCTRGATACAPGSLLGRSPVHPQKEGWIRVGKAPSLKGLRERRRQRGLPTATGHRQDLHPPAGAHPRPRERPSWRPGPRSSPRSAAGHPSCRARGPCRQPGRGGRQAPLRRCPGRAGHAAPPLPGSPRTHPCSAPRRSGRAWGTSALRGDTHHHPAAPGPAPGPAGRAGRRGGGGAGSPRLTVAGGDGLHMHAHAGAGAARTRSARSPTEEGPRVRSRGGQRHRARPSLP